MKLSKKTYFGAKVKICWIIMGGHCQYTFLHSDSRPMGLTLHNWKLSKSKKSIYWNWNIAILKIPCNTLEILNSFRLIFDLSKLNFLSWLWFLLFLLFSIFSFFLLSTLTEYFVWVEKGKQAVPGYVTRI